MVARPGATVTRQAITERQIHASCVEWLRWAHPGVKAHHSMNEGRRGWRAQADVKALGVWRGFPDLVLLHQGAVLFVELKRPGGRLEQTQRQCHEDLRAQGFDVVTVYSVEEFQQTVGDWMQMLKPASI